MVDTHTVANDLLTVPRILFAPLRLVVRALGDPVSRLAALEEKHHVGKRIVRLFTSDDGLRGVRPEIMWSISFSLLYGLSYFDRKLLGPDTSFLATAMMGGFASQGGIKLYLRPLALSRAAQLEVESSYFRRSDQIFTGIGEVGGVLRPSRYAVDSTDLGLKLTARPSQPLRLLVGFSFGLRRFGNGERMGDDPPIEEVFCVRDHGPCVGPIVDERLVPGYTKGTQFLRGGVGMSGDTRDRIGKPSSGLHAEMWLDYSHGIVSDPSSYFRVRATVTGYVDLWQRTRVLVVRASTNLILQTGAAPVPFSELAILGGPDDLRGLRYGRLRDYSTLLVSAEYRWPIWMWMDGLVFVDAGAVAGQLYRDFSFERIRPAVGGGVRLRTSERFYIRLQAAWGPSDGSQFFLALTSVP